MAKSNRPCLYLWRSNSWWYAQVVDKPTCCVLAAACARRRQHTTIARQLAARCLAIGVFELNHVTRYAGNAASAIVCLRSLGVSV